MQLDRNINPDGKGKYALLNLRKDKVEWGRTGSEDEFFVVKLKDRHSTAALNAYADSIRGSDPVFAEEVRELAKRSGIYSPWCKDPD